MLLVKKQDASLKQTQISHTLKTVDDLKFLLHLGLDLKILVSIHHNTACSEQSPRVLGIFRASTRS